ncbi:G2/mitotic-specific cyclin-B [Cyphomyrmex costatus]|uniref:G2/mitotic-specific cyclin-B n=1 Tax=Cyphomyrmex costatus TaxID=456900 RepID=A0A151IE64_9HYME|nr:G2/mitotic-specific cyclin-B [Cyphomyrmex costatus]
MATRNRTAVTVSHANQENIKNTKSSVVVPTKGKRAVLGEISNRVNTLRGVEPIDRSSLLQRKKVVVPKRQAIKPNVNPSEKPPVQIVKPIVKQIAKTTSSSNVNNARNVVNVPAVVSQKREERNSFSTDLLKFEDIDEQDKNNPILVSIYTNDIHEYLRTLEIKFTIKKGYLAGQEITPKMRCVLVDWLVEVHQQFRLMQETLYLTIAIIDRFLHTHTHTHVNDYMYILFLQLFRAIDRKKLQLVGVTAMFIASKYEEMYSPDISDFVYITDKAYSKADILNMEMLIVRTLDYSFGRPLPLHFLRRYSKAGKALPIHHTMAKYFLEESLVYYEMCHYPPSLIAAAAIYLAFLLIGNDEEDEGKVIWTSTLAYYSTYSKDDVLPAVRDIAAIIINVGDSKYQAVRKKYVHVKHMKISIRPELKSPIMFSIAAKSNES